MPTTVEDLVAQALGLPPEDRAKLVERLLDSNESGIYSSRTRTAGRTVTSGTVSITSFAFPTRASTNCMTS